MTTYFIISHFMGGFRSSNDDTIKQKFLAPFNLGQEDFPCSTAKFTRNGINYFLNIHETAVCKGDDYIMITTKKGVCVWYEHHGKQVCVREDLKGKHVDYCLCWTCRWFCPSQIDWRVRLAAWCMKAMRRILFGGKRPCGIARVLFAFCVAFDAVTPMWECPETSQVIDSAS